MEMIKQILIGAILTETLVEYIGMVFDKCVYLTHLKCSLSLLIGVIVAFSFGLDIIPFLGLQTHIPHIGVVMTGILMSRGSNYLADFLKNKVKKW